MTRHLAIATFAAAFGSHAVAAHALMLFESCDPLRWSMLDAPAAEVPVLASPERRDLPPGEALLPDIAPAASILDLASVPREIPDLAAPRRSSIPDRVAQADELPPTRAAQLLPAARDVPTLAAPKRSYEIPTTTAYLPDLAAPSRSLDSGARSRPVVEELRGCTPALVLAIPCHLLARADHGERAGRYP